MFQNQVILAWQWPGLPLICCWSSQGCRNLITVAQILNRIWVISWVSLWFCFTLHWWLWSLVSLWKRCLCLKLLCVFSHLQHRCVAIFKDKVNKPTGFALGSIEGRVAIHYINPPNPWVFNNTSSLYCSLFFWDNFLLFHSDEKKKLFKFFF